MTPITQSVLYSHAISTPAYDPEGAIKAEFGRLIHAAIISQGFCKKLLNNPLRTIESGFCGESFHFSPELKERIQLIHAQTLESFSMQLLQTIQSSPIPKQVEIHYR